MRSWAFSFLTIFSTAAAAESLVLLNGNIHTANSAQPRAEALVVIDGRIAAVGTAAEALRRAPAGARRIDLKGQTVLPGLTDAHAHLSAIGFRELDFDLEGVESLAALQARVAQRVTATRPGDWVAGRGWIESRWTPAQFPTRQDLDAVAADRPVALRRADGHSLLVNTLALQRAGIDRNTPDPPGGRILKDPATGEPTGMLIDDAMDPVVRLIPPHTDAQILQALEVGARRSVQLGWTQLQYAGTTWKEVELLCQLYAQKRIQLRTYVAIGGPGPDADRLLKEGPSINRCGDRLTVRSIKLYIDGALGSRGAALLAPYSDAPESKGLIVNTPESLLPILTRALERGIQIETHAIGDRANRLMLDTYEKAFAAVPAKRRAVPEPRWRIEHAQVIDPADIPRFARIGVIASMQPSHAIGDLLFAPKRLGPDRLSGAYAWHALLDSGATVAAGTDAPVEKGDPRIEFYAAVTRKTLEGFSEAGWHPEQRVSREQALIMMTRAPAFAAFQERERGSIETGKLADLSVFSADPMTIAAVGIAEIEPVLTIIGGEIAFARE